MEQSLLSFKSKTWQKTIVISLSGAPTLKVEHGQKGLSLKVSSHLTSIYVMALAFAQVQFSKFSADVSILLVQNSFYNCKRIVIFISGLWCGPRYLWYISIILSVSVLGEIMSINKKLSPLMICLRLRWQLPFIILLYQCFSSCTKKKETY